ncbi:MAG: DUF4097 family beta strand repeat-containing protein [Aggregatilineales bacterium]
MTTSTAPTRARTNRSGLHTNWLWPVLLIGAAGLWLAQVAGIVPAAVADWISRAWPIALIVLGLHGLIGGRVRYASFVIVGLCAAIVAGVIVIAYGKQSGQFRQDYHADFTQALTVDVQHVKLNVSTLITQIEIDPGDGRMVNASFVGSAESRVTTDYHVDQGVGTVTITESRPSAIPSLTATGRGKLTLQLPVGVPIDSLTIRAGTGNLTLDATGVSLQKLDVALQSGDVTITLPQLAANAALGGGVKTASGNLTFRVPTGLTVQLTLTGGHPDFDANNYLLLTGGILQTAGTKDFQVALTAGASGTVAVKAP